MYKTAQSLPCAQNTISVHILPLSFVALLYVTFLTAPSVIETTENTRKLNDFELKMQTVQLPKRRAALKYKMMCEVHNNNTLVSQYILHSLCTSSRWAIKKNTCAYTKTGCVMSGQFGEKFRTPDRLARNLVTIPTELPRLLHTTSKR